MKLKDIVEYTKRKDEQVEEGRLLGGFEEIAEIGEYFNEKSDLAEKFITERMSEENFVRLIHTAQMAMLTSLIGQGEGVGLLVALQAEELDAFAQTIVLQMIGVLIDEEIL